MTDVDYTKFEGADLVHELNDDADKWATAFLQHNPSASVDQHTLMGWFANAIERAHDYRTGHIINGEHAQYLTDRARTSPTMIDEARMPHDR